METKNEDVLKMFIISLHIANFLFIFVEVINSVEFFPFTINTFMFFSSTSIGIYSLDPKTKKIKNSRLKALKFSFWSAVGCIFLMILSLIEIKVFLMVILVMLKIYTVFAGFYCTYLLIKIDSEVSNNDKKNSFYLKEAINDSIIKKIPNEKKAEHNKKSRRFILENSRKGKKK